jgi:hypothetical protein
MRKHGCRLILSVLSAVLPGGSALAALDIATALRENSDRLIGAHIS